MKRAISAIAVATSLLLVTACGAGSEETVASSIPEEVMEYTPDGTVTIDLRSINGDVYASIAEEGKRTTPEKIEAILDEVEGEVTEGHTLYIEVFDLTDKYRFEGKTKYRVGYASEAVDDVLGDEFDWDYDDDSRVSIPYETLVEYYEGRA